MMSCALSPYILKDENKQNYHQQCLTSTSISHKISVIQKNWKTKHYIAKLCKPGCIFWYISLLLSTTQNLAAHLGQWQCLWSFHITAGQRLRHCWTMVLLVKIWATWPYMLSVSLIRCKNEALRRIELQNRTSKVIKCFKEVKIEKWLALLYSFSPHRLLC